MQDIIGSPITEAGMDNSEPLAAAAKEDYDDSHTWTAFRLATATASVIIYWLGESNGYYSEDAEFGPVRP